LGRFGLAAAKKQALLDYGALVGEHGCLVRRRWTLGESLDDPSLLETRKLAQSPMPPVYTRPYRKCELRLSA
jgi:hypothetical protein